MTESDILWALRGYLEGMHLDDISGERFDPLARARLLMSLLLIGDGPGKGLAIVPAQVLLDANTYGVGVLIRGEDGSYQAADPRTVHFSPEEPRT